MLALLLLACTADPTGHDAPRDVTLEEIAAEDDAGVALLDGERVTVEGVLTVGASVLAGRKLRVHIQDGEYGCAVDADEVVAAWVADATGGLEAGDRLQITGRVTQEDLPSAHGPGAWDGLTRVRVEDAADVERVATGEALPAPRLLTVADVLADGDTHEGVLVRIDGVHKDPVDAETWADELSLTAMVDLRDSTDGPLKLRLGKGELTGGYGDDPGEAVFDVIGLLREDQQVAPESDPDGTSFEVWARGADDILR